MALIACRSLCGRYLDLPFVRFLVVLCSLALVHLRRRLIRFDVYLIACGAVWYSGAPDPSRPGRCGDVPVGPRPISFGLDSAPAVIRPSPPCQRDGTNFDSCSCINTERYGNTDRD